MSPCHFGMIRSVALVVAVGVMAGCSAPGTPPTLAVSSDASIPYCQTLPNNAATVPFVEDYYLTTWGSAYREGATAGVRDGLNDGSALGTSILAQLRAPTTYKGKDVFSIDYDSDPFCMAFAAPFGQVRAATSKAFQELRTRGYRVTFHPGEVPSYETSFQERSHRSAEWIERFIAAVERLPDGRTVVVLSRGVYIARDESGYYQGNSVGQNEAAILTRIRDLIQ